MGLLGDPKNALAILRASPVRGRALPSPWSAVCASWGPCYVHLHLLLVGLARGEGPGVFVPVTPVSVREGLVALGTSVFRLCLLQGSACGPWVYTCPGVKWAAGFLPSPAGSKVSQQSLPPVT